VVSEEEVHNTDLNDDEDLPSTSSNNTDQPTLF